MATASRQFQIFTKPIGSVCNLDCDYCYYLKTGQLYPNRELPRMPDNILESYIVQHIDACPDSEIRFSWHGGEPTILGMDYFQNVVALQHKHKPLNRSIINGIQTNGTLIDEKWSRFFAETNFTVGLSLDGPSELHDRHRLTKSRGPTHKQAMRGYHLLRQRMVPCDILCVVNATNVQHPKRVYRFFKEIKAEYISFLPLVEPEPGSERGVSRRTVPAEAFGNFLCTIFDEWLSQDIGRIKVQIFEEVARTGLGHEHALCIFRKTCGDVPVVEHNGDFFSCDHFVDTQHLLGNIKITPLVELLESRSQRIFGNAKSDTLPRYCQTCAVLSMCNGGCLKDRFLRTPDGEEGLNYLCAGYKRFFNHCRPFVAGLAALRGRHAINRRKPILRSTENRPGRKIGRNDPCPCGSGRKYKKCCLAK